jgi:hypothetical protein
MPRVAFDASASLRWRTAMPGEQDYLLYPLDTGEDPACLRCGTIMGLAGQEVRETKPDFISFRCEKCGRSEKFICED